MRRWPSSPPPASGLDVKPLPLPKAKRGPSKQLLESFPLAAEGVVYVDAEGLYATPVAAAIAKASAPLLAAMEGDRACATTVVSSTKELAVATAGDGKPLFLVRYDPAAEGALVPCVAVWKRDTKPTTVDGARSAFEGGAGRDVEVAALGSGLLAIGPNAAVHAAFGGHTVGRSKLSQVALGEDEYGAFDVPIPNGTGRVSGGLVVTKERSTLAVRAALKDPEDAAGLEQMFQRGRSAWRDQPKAPEAQLFDRVLTGFTFERKGATVQAAYQLAGSPEEQARDLATTATLAIHGVRRYIANAKRAEAKNALGRIARSIVAEWEREEVDAKGKVTPRRSKKLASFPPVPKAVPRGEKVQTSPEDWKDWARLHFEMSSAPQYFQYEVRAAKDGESADVLARGDLNGDGKTSLFKVTVKLDRKNDALVIVPKVEETDPDE